MFKTYQLDGLSLCTSPEDVKATLDELGVQDNKAYRIMLLYNFLEMETFSCAVGDVTGSDMIEGEYAFAVDQLLLSNRRQAQ